MVKLRWTLGSLVLALTIFGAADARALTPYVHEGPDKTCSAKVQSCCSQKSAGHWVGSFELEDVAQDNASGHVCSTKTAGASGMTCPLTAAGSGLAQIASGPFILAGAVLNDGYELLTMPYRKAQPLN